MSILEPIKRSLGAKIALKLALLLLVLMAIAAVLITTVQTQQMEQATMEKARSTVTQAARQYGDMFDAAIDAGLLTVNEAFDTNYAEIKGWSWGPKPKYHTRYDTLCDRSVLVFQDKILEHDQDYLYAVGADVNGYVPTHNTRAQRPLDGSERDLLENRTKRLFNSNATEVNRVKSTEPFLLQVYHRDTGETLWDASAPIWVKGKHWGAFVLGVSMQRMEARKQALILTLTGVFALFAVATLGSIFILVRGAMRPVVALTEAADLISTGEGLETPIKTAAVDEIGRLTKSIDRLRASMKAAMARLGH
jgi:HAMP domain-containing protein/type II secretory pathway pseudopilin PulG